MSELLNIIKNRRSVRTPYDTEKKISIQDLEQILEAARWSPTAHNMQNYEIIIIENQNILEELSNIKAGVTETFLRENYQQLSFSEEEYLRKKVGLLAEMLPESWRIPDFTPDYDSTLGANIKKTSALLILTFDATKRAPDSPGDFLGIISLGCIMENMWLMANSLGIDFHVVSDFGEGHIEHETKKILNIPEKMKIAFGIRLGYRTAEPKKFPRVRREVQDFTYFNKYGNK